MILVNKVLTPLPDKTSLGFAKVSFWPVKPFPFGWKPKKIGNPGAITAKRLFPVSDAENQFFCDKSALPA